jgi:hypothetical protein
MHWWREAAAMRREIGQLLWAVSLFDLIIAGLGVLTSGYFGTAALGVTLGLAAFVTGAVLLIVALNLLGAALVDLIRCMWRGAATRRRRPGTGGDAA